MEVAPRPRPIRFKVDSRPPYGDGFVAVRILSDGEDFHNSNCGVLVFGLEEWFAFHALLAGKSEAVPVTFEGFDEVRAALAARTSEAIPDAIPDAEGASR